MESELTSILNNKIANFEEQYRPKVAELEQTHDDRLAHLDS